MKGTVAVEACALALLLVAAFIPQSWSAPQGHFQRRNWTPQAMLYLKGAQGRRFISEERREGDFYEGLHLATRSQNTNPTSLSDALALLLPFISRAREEAEENAEQLNLLETPRWKRGLF
ncbi:spexin prohormone 1-like isoform X2 [Polyodon spathula]|uniref:spexin prohormone 1-like isoform X2 n=1 Tax=Polyodon spathula TaxID=7913 RepID=UPI001B7E1D81|nr:spexin prohormone 1-like isoform X2 [Polyodon spathula]